MRVWLVGVVLCGLVACAGRGTVPVYDPGADDMVAPRLLTEVKPRYTSEAMEAGIEGRVGLAATVRPDGTVDDIVVAESLDRTFGLDDQAVGALAGWRFAPGTLRGDPVNVRVSIEFYFSLDSSRGGATRLGA